MTSQDFYPNNMPQKFKMADSGKNAKNSSNFKHLSIQERERKGPKIFRVCYSHYEKHFYQKLGDSEWVG